MGGGIGGTASGAEGEEEEEDEREDAEDVPDLRTSSSGPRTAVGIWSAIGKAAEVQDSTHWAYGSYASASAFQMVVEHVQSVRGVYG